MSKLTKVPFFCNECQQFTFLPLGLTPHPLCSFCHTALDRLPARQKEVSSESSPLNETTETKSSSSSSKRRKSSNEIRRKKKTRLSYLRIFSFWLILLLFFGIIAFFIYHTQSEKKAQIARQPLPEITYTRALLNAPFSSSQMSTLTQQLLKEFCSKSDPLEKAVLTHNPSENTVKMRRFYKTQPLEILVSAPRLVKLSFIEQETGKAIQSTWENPLTGKIWEVSLRANAFDEWLLDWEEFVRYNEYSLQAFLDDSKDVEEADFRILLEKVSSSNDNETETPFYLVKIFPPTPNGDQPRPLLQKAPPLLFIEKNSPVGQSLRNYWKKIEHEDLSGRGLALSDPAETLRLSVKLKKRPATEEEPAKVEIAEIYHEGWSSR